MNTFAVHRFARSQSFIYKFGYILLVLVVFFHSQARSSFLGEVNLAISLDNLRRRDAEIGGSGHVN